MLFFCFFFWIFSTNLSTRVVLFEYRTVLTGGSYLTAIFDVGMLHVYQYRYQYRYRTCTQYQYIVLCNTNV